MPQSSIDEEAIRLNALLQKSAGDITNLTRTEVNELRQLTSTNIAREYREILHKHYPGKTLIAALLLESAYQRRINRTALAKMMDMSLPHLNRIIAGTVMPGVSVAKKIRRHLNIDGDFILNNM